MMTVEITQVDTVELERAGDNVQTDVYEVVFTGDDAADHEDETTKRVNGMQIGCPSCKENAFAFFSDDTYTCSICRDHEGELEDKHITKRGIFSKSIR